MSCSYGGQGPTLPLPEGLQLLPIPTRDFLEAWQASCAVDSCVCLLRDQSRSLCGFYEHSISWGKLRQFHFLNCFSLPAPTPFQLSTNSDCKAADLREVRPLVQSHSTKMWQTSNSNPNTCMTVHNSLKDTREKLEPSLFIFGATDRGNFFKIIIIILICVCVYILPSCMFMYHIYAWCPQRPEESVEIEFQIVVNCHVGELNPCPLEGVLLT